MNSQRPEKMPTKSCHLHIGVVCLQVSSDGRGNTTIYELTCNDTWGQLQHKISVFTLLLQLLTKYLYSFLSSSLDCQFTCLRILDTECISALGMYEKREHPFKSIFVESVEVQEETSSREVRSDVLFCFWVATRRGSGSSTCSSFFPPLAILRW